MFPALALYRSSFRHHMYSTFTKEEYTSYKNAILPHERDMPGQCTELLDLLRLGKTSPHAKTKFLDIYRKFTVDLSAPNTTAKKKIMRRRRRRIINDE